MARNQEGGPYWKSQVTPQATPTKVGKVGYPKIITIYRKKIVTQKKSSEKVTSKSVEQN